MNTQFWNFSINDLDDAVKYFNENGFVGFYDLLSLSELNEIISGVDQAIQEKKLIYGLDDLIPNQDIIFAHPIIEKYCKDERIVNFVKSIISRPIELQHSKFNAKPIESTTTGEIQWHQDFNFYPHTNFDLIAGVIHIDDEEISSGPLVVIPGSHKWGVKSHCKNDEFIYECTEMDSIDKSSSIPLTCKAGQVIFHHCLTLHYSAAKTNDHHRRHIIYQYRAQDAVQLSSVIWKCMGYKVDNVENKGIVRLADGTIFENRGKDGKLYDRYGRFKPDKVGQKGNWSYS